MALRLQWETGIDTEAELVDIHWQALEEYAVTVKRKADPHIEHCKISQHYTTGGVHVIRLLQFDDGSTWLARVHKYRATAQTKQRLLQDVYTTQLIHQSKVPVPEIFAYNASVDNKIGRSFMIMEYIEADSAMEKGGRGRISDQRFRNRFYAEMAMIQVQLASIRFPKIGSVVREEDGSYSVGPIPDLGGPFENAGDYFEAWGRKAHFPYNEKFVRERTPPEFVDDCLASIRDFPSRIMGLAKRHRFQEGPFPIVHPDLYKSNILVDPEYHVKGIVDWENAIAGPWETVQFIKDLCPVPELLDGPLHKKSLEDIEDQAEYVRVAQEAERTEKLDDKLSSALSERNQYLSSAITLYTDGRIGFYNKLLDAWEQNI